MLELFTWKVADIVGQQIKKQSWREKVKGVVNVRLLISQFRHWKGEWGLVAYTI